MHQIARYASELLLQSLDRAASYIPITLMHKQRREWSSTSRERMVDLGGENFWHTVFDVCTLHVEIKLRQDHNTGLYGYGCVV